jgi:hypothetical protein
LPAENETGNTTMKIVDTIEDKINKIPDGQVFTYTDFDIEVKRKDTEVNPYQKQQLTTFVSDYLLKLERQVLIEKYQLSPFAFFPQRRCFSEKERGKICFDFKNNAYFWCELFDSIAPQSA